MPKKLEKTTGSSCRSSPAVDGPYIGPHEPDCQHGFLKKLRSPRTPQNCWLFAIHSLCASAPASALAPKKSRSRVKIPYGKRAPFAPPSTGFLVARRSGRRRDPTRAISSLNCLSLSPDGLSRADAGFGLGIVLGPSRRLRGYRHGASDRGRWPAPYAGRSSPRLASLAHRHGPHRPDRRAPDRRGRLLRPGRGIEFRRTAHSRGQHPRPTRPTRWSIRARATGW